MGWAKTHRDRLKIKKYLAIAIVEAYRACDIGIQDYEDKLGDVSISEVVARGTFNSLPGQGRRKIRYCLKLSEDGPDAPIFVYVFCWVPEFFKGDNKPDQAAFIELDIKPAAKEEELEHLLDEKGTDFKGAVLIILRVPVKDLPATIRSASNLINAFAEYVGDD